MHSANSCCPGLPGQRPAPDPGTASCTQHPAAVVVLHTNTPALPPLAVLQAEVLVCVKGPDGSLPLRMLLVQQLWALGIRAELLPRACPELREQYEWAAAHGIRWLVLIDEARLGPAGGKQEVRVKSLERRSEEWVALADVTRYMQVGGWGWWERGCGTCDVCCRSADCTPRPAGCTQEAAQHVWPTGWMLGWLDGQMHCWMAD